MLTDEVRYKLLRLLEGNPKMSQRDVARELGISLGKVNYCLKLLVEKGWIKAINFKRKRRESLCGSCKEKCGNMRNCEST